MSVIPFVKQVTKKGHELEVAFVFFSMEFWALLDRKCKTFSIRVKTNACLDSLAVDSFFSCLPHSRMKFGQGLKGFWGFALPVK